MAVIDSTATRNQAGNFLTALLDLSFASFITLKLIRILYMLGMFVGALAALAAIVAAFNVHSGLGVIALFLSPLIFLFVLVAVRVSLELIAIVFRIEENTARTQSGL